MPIFSANAMPEKKNKKNVITLFISKYYVFLKKEGRSV